MTLTKINSYLTYFLLFFIGSMYGYTINILNTDQTPDCLKKFTVTTDIKGAVLNYKGDDNDNYLLTVNYPSHETTTIVIPKNVSGDLPVYTLCTKTNKKILYGLVRAHDGSIQAHNREKIEDFKSIIPQERIIKLPKAEDKDQNSCSSDSKTFNELSNYDDFSPKDSAPSIIGNSEYCLWKDLLLATGCATVMCLSYYCLISNIEACARYLAGVERWSSWKSDEPIQSLLLVKPEYLANDLIQDIKTTYYEESNPVALFLEDLEEEYETIVQWIQFRNKISFLGLLGSNFYAMEQRLALLEHMRKAVHHWRAYEMEKKLVSSN